MNELRRTTLRLTVKYSLIFFAFIWLFSCGVYVWVDNSLGEGYVNRINHVLVQQHSSSTHTADIPDNAAASVAADIALDRLLNILLSVNVLALVAIPLVAYQISRRALLPLIESQRSQRRFIANASHELRTPLAVMLAELDWAAKKERTLNEYKATTTNARDEVLRMSNLVKSLLLLAQLDDRQKQNNDVVDVAWLTEEAIRKHEAGAKAKNITFHPKLQTAELLGNADLLAVAIGNLIENAVKYSPRKSVIDVCSVTADKVTQISITNLTDGLTQEDVKHLFDRFYQAGTHQGQAGFGLGLAIAKQIAESHYGTVSARLDDNVITISLAFEARPGRFG
jgi:signal transduction histidine kinase